MGLTYHYKFKAPANRTAAELKTFLEGVEGEAQRVGFSPTMVLDAVFDTAERKEFSRRLTHGLVVEDGALKGAELDQRQVWCFNSLDGSCRVIPERGVVLVVSDEQAGETVFGFFRYPAFLRRKDGGADFPTGAGGAWVFEDFIKTPEARFRTIVKCFAEAGYLETEADDYAK